MHISEEFPIEAAAPVCVNNAGIVLVVPYFTRLFSMLKLTDNNVFTGVDAQIRAACLIRLMTHPGKGFPDTEMQLNKWLVGLRDDQVIPPVFEPTQEEIDTIRDLLSALLKNWPKLKNTSIEAFRDAFLQRAGHFEKKSEGYYDFLTVEDRAYDLLLDSCPWNFRTLKLPWTPKVLQVKWR